MQRTDLDNYTRSPVTHADHGVQVIVPKAAGMHEPYEISVNAKLRERPAQIVVVAFLKASHSKFETRKLRRRMLLPREAIQHV